MENEKKINWETIIWTILKFLFLIVINGATIAWFVLHCIEIDISVNNQVIGTISYWDAMSNDNIYKMITNLGDINGWQGKLAGMLPDYHWYNTALVYGFMLFGYTCSFFFIRSLYRKREKRKDREYETKEREKDRKATKDMWDNISKIMEGKK